MLNQRSNAIAAGLGAMLWLAAGSVAGATELREVRIGRHASFTRVVFETDSKSSYELTRSRKGNLQVRLEAEAMPRVVRSKSRTVREVAVAQEGAGALARVRLHDPSVDVKEMVLTNPPRIVIDLYPSKVAWAPPPAVAVAESAPQPEPQREPDPVPEPSPAAVPAPAPVAEAEAAKPEVVAEAALEAEVAEVEAQVEAAVEQAKEQAAQAEEEIAEAEAVASEAEAEIAKDEAVASELEAELALVEAELEAADAEAGAEATEVAEAAEAAVEDDWAAEAEALAASDQADEGDELAGEQPEEAVSDEMAPMADEAEELAARDAMPPTVAPPAVPPKRQIVPSGTRPADTVSPVSVLPPPFDDPYVLAGVGALIVLIGALVVVRRRASRADDEASPFATDEPTPMEEPEYGVQESAIAQAMSDEVEDAVEPYSMDDPIAPPGDEIGMSETDAETEELQRSIFDAEEDEEEPKEEREMEAGFETPESSGFSNPIAAAGGEDVMRLIQELQSRMENLEQRLEEVTDAKERLERQVAAQTEELRVQRAAIARTQRVLRTVAKPEEEATEPAPKIG